MFMTEQTEHSEQTVLVKSYRHFVPLTCQTLERWTYVDSVDTTQAETMKMGLVEDRSRVFSLESVSTNAIYILPVSMTLQRAATMQA